MAKGLDDLRRAYGNIGYVNFTAVPETRFDDAKGLISLVVNLDTGKQFRVGRITIFGMETPAAADLLETSGIKPGKIFNTNLWSSLLVLESRRPQCNCPDQERVHFDDYSGIANVTLDFRPCSAN